ncbi:putative quinol monooxygenase [Rhizorhabdus argentea]|uniref:putative quinol monooxygenase n=1 Tax=Rhizorhabdus argentea TaxID=1387174 RepID=UPI0030EBAAEE
MGTWERDANCFVSRFKVDPAKRAEFLEALDELARNAVPWYEEGCNFAFHGWGRDPNEWVAIASWKSEEFVNRMRQTDWYKDTQQRMLECSTGSMIMEQFSGMNVDRSVFDEYPAGSSQVHMKTHTLDVVFL